MESIVRFKITDRFNKNTKKFSCTLLSLIFASLNFRDFKNIAKLKTRLKKGPRKLKTRKLEPNIKTFIKVFVCPRLTYSTL